MLDAPGGVVRASNALLSLLRIDQPSRDEEALSMLVSAALIKRRPHRKVNYELA